MTDYVDDLIMRLKEGERALEEDLERVRAALRLLVEDTRLDAHPVTGKPLRLVDRIPERDLEPIDAERVLARLDEEATHGNAAAIELKRTIDGTPGPVVKIKKLPDSGRMVPASVREAAVDDVLALVATGVSNPRAIRDELPYLSKGTRGFLAVYKRLAELRREGMVTGPSAGKWSPTPAALSLNWIENRAREIARRNG